MKWLSQFGRRLLMLFRRSQFDRDLEDEMRLHRELREQEQLEAGVAPEEARYAARRRFGNDLVLREESHEMWGWNSVETLIQDVRYGLRQLRRSPAPRCWCHLEWDPLEPPVIPAKAGIQSDDSTFPKACGVDSSRHGGTGMTRSRK
jgi:hypothetical protein